MKKSIFILITAAVVFASARSQDTKDYVVLGQLNGTFGHGTLNNLITR